MAQVRGQPVQLVVGQVTEEAVFPVGDVVKLEF